MNDYEKGNPGFDEDKKFQQGIEGTREKEATRNGLNDNRKKMQYDSFFEVFRKSLDVLMIIEPESHKILQVSDKVEQLFGYFPDQMIDEKFDILFPEKEDLYDYNFLKEIHAFDAVLTDQPFLHISGDIVLVDLTAVIIQWQNQDRILINIRDTQERRQAEKTQAKLVKDLQEALNKVKLLKGLLPICSHCKKIRDDEGYWTQIEEYIREHSEAEFSHSICPTCIKTHYGDLDLHELDAGVE